VAEFVCAVCQATKPIDTVELAETGDEPLVCDDCFESFRSSVCSAQRRGYTCIRKKTITTLLICTPELIVNGS
jgi:hypothetical protein